MTVPIEPKLAKPGSGLPIPLRWIARFMVPYRAQKSNWNENAQRYSRYSQAIDEIVKSLTTDQLNQKILVDPIVGLEDSSRYWSIAMTLDHIMIVSTHISQVVSELSHDKIPAVEVRVENVKPPAQLHDLNIVAKFNRFWPVLISSISIGPDLNQTKLKHPWFGKLNAHQWFYILCMHQGIHLKQIKEISRQLGSAQSPANKPR